MRYWTLEKTISTIHKASDKQMIFIVCETPQDVLALVEGGVFICSFRFFYIILIIFSFLTIDSIGFDYILSILHNKSQ